MVDKKTEEAPRGPSAIWVNKPEAGQLPDGVTHHTFYSEVQKEDVGYCIYLPPGYDPEDSGRYPVIYNLHGAGDSDASGDEVSEHVLFAV